MLIRHCRLNKDIQCYSRIGLMESLPGGNYDHSVGQERGMHVKVYCFGLMVEQ